MKPKKHLGQHFLTAPTYALQTVDALPAAADEHLLEIGPGQGALSVFLKKRFPYFHLIEVDPDAIAYLGPVLGSGSFTLHRGDVLAFDFGKVGFPLHVVGNLPYSIGAMIIKKTLLYGNSIRSCTFMVQREVAERIVSGPHHKTNGFLTIFCSFFGSPKLLFHVPPSAFFPPPKIDSSVFQIIIDENLEQKLPQEQWSSFFALVSRGFQQRRKMLVNVLGGDAAEKEKLRAVLGTLGLSSMVRPEDLAVNDWLAFYLGLC